MPNHGRSGGCRTCKRRRVKCDEARPACSPCQRLRISCEGYSKTFLFRDQTHKFKQRLVEVATVEPSRSLLTGDDVAVPFFLEHSAHSGRSLATGRGFFETLIPAYNSQSPHSALSLAVGAVATKVFSLWRHDDNASTEPYAQAAAALRTAIGRTQERQRPATALAILAMHLYENISAIYDLRPAIPVHHHGALSLLPMIVSDGLDGLTSTYAQNFVLHLEVSSALRQKRAIQPNVVDYMTSRGGSTVPYNISLALDLIGACVAELQADYMRSPASRQPSASSALSSRDWITEAKRIDELLRAWAHSIPDHLRPLRLSSGRDFSPSIPAYQSACDIYTSSQLANIWNLWRIQRITLLKIALGSVQSSTTVPRQASLSVEVPSIATSETTSYIHWIREYVDGICYSVPFYLGNRTRPSSLADFGDPDILFPSYHSLTTGRSSVAAPQQDGDSTVMPNDEHRRHMIANGPWHIMSPLSNLLTLFSDDCGGRIVASCIELEHQDWIREQFMRVAKLLSLPTAGRRVAAESFRKTEGGSYSPSSIVKTDEVAADSLARRVRKGAVFMSGP